MFEQILEQLALGLERRSIPYIVIGGQAVLLYGKPRLTRDIDLILRVGRILYENGLRTCKSSNRCPCWRSSLKRTLHCPCMAAATIRESCQWS